MASVTEYIKESYIELAEKVTWPTWRELQSSSIVVLITSIIIALIIVSMDQVVDNLLRFLYSSL